jgi:hypothetical protein
VVEAIGMGLIVAGLAVLTARGVLAGRRQEDRPTEPVGLPERQPPHAADAPKTELQA